MSEQGERIAKALCTANGLKPEDEAVLVEVLEEKIEEPKERRYHEPDFSIEWD